MKTVLRIAAVVAVPLALAACNETSNGYDRSGGGGLFGSSGGLFGTPQGDYNSGYDARDRRGGGPYAHNGRCDDPAYNTSNGGRASRGSDDFDCSRYGEGLKR